MLALGLIDAIVPEPTGGAHNNPDARDRARRPGALGQALAEVAALSVDERLDARYEKFRRWGRKGTAFVDDAAVPPAAAPARARQGMKSLLWQHLPCDDEQAPALAAALGVHPDRRAAAVHARACATRTQASALPEPVARSPARSVQARRHGPRGRPPRAGAGAAASASPSTATTTSTASRRR